MKKILIGGTILLSLTAFSFFQENNKIVDSTNLVKGEHIEYRVHYGFVNAAEAVVDVDDKFQMANGRPCYKVVVNGRTTGVTDWVTRVRDTWASHIDSEKIMPHQFYMKKQEGNYKAEEKVIFDHQQNVAKTFELIDDKEKKTLSIPDGIQDVVSSYYYVRAMDFNKTKPGESYPLSFFFDNKIYNMRLKFKGKETIKTKFGKIETYKIIPMLPKNNFFVDEESVIIWVSNDANKIPIRVEIGLKIGALALDLRSYSGLKQDLKFDNN